MQQLICRAYLHLTEGIFFHFEKLNARWGLTRQSCWQSTALTLPEHNLRGDDDSDEDNNSYGDDGDGDGNDDQCKNYNSFYDSQTPRLVCLTLQWVEHKLK